MKAPFLLKPFVVGGDEENCPAYGVFYVIIIRKCVAVSCFEYSSISTFVVQSWSIALLKMRSAIGNAFLGVIV